MILKPFSDLDAAERNRLFDGVVSFGTEAPFPSAAAMADAFSSPAYAGGRHLLTLWAPAAQAAGAIGVITKEAAVRREVFLTPLYAAERRAPEVVPLLLEAAGCLMAEAGAVPPAVTVRLGVRPSFSYLHAAVEQAGFRPCYRVVELSRPTPGVEPPPSPLAFVPVSEANLADYIAVHNGAFRMAPNGATTDVAEIRALLAEYDSPDWLQIGYAGDDPVAVVEVGLHEGYGQIDTIGVAPAVQGRGFGRAALYQAIRTLRRHGAPELRLGVVEANRAAYTLYETEGFAYRRTLAQWFVSAP